MCVVNGIKLSRADFIEFMQTKKDVSHLNMNRAVQYGFDYLDWPVLKPIAGRRDFEVVNMDWEFRPFWVNDMEEMQLIRKGIDPKTRKQGQPIPWLNAKGETLTTSPMFKEAALQRRCLVLTSGFMEWRHHFPIGKKGKVLKTAEKYPYHISVKSNRDYFFLDGIYNPWTDRSTGETMNTFAIVTTAANDVMKMIHNSKNRMPTILPDDIAEQWLVGNLTEDDITAFATYQFPSEQMEYHTIKKDFLKLEDPCEPCLYAELDAPSVGKSQRDLFS